MIDKNDNFIVWDLTKPIFFLPEEIKKIYTRSYRFYYKKYNLWINKISEDNSLNINWWFSRPASRDERLSNLYKNICIIKSLKDLDKSAEYITLEDVIPILEKSLNNNGIDKNMIRELSEDLSIRNGKFGAYVFYKTKTMKKPQFLNIKKFKESYLTCEKEVIIKWLEDNYPILKS